MSNPISNHFTITALQDGVTVQGSLRVNGSLSQNYNPATGKSVPDWKSDAASRPSVYPVIRKGANYISASEMAGSKWLYNDVEIVFGSDGKSTNFKDAGGNAVAWADRFVNEFGFELPQTGGTGRMLYAAGGLLLTAAGALLLYHQARRRRGDKPSS